MPSRMREHVTECHPTAATMEHERSPTSPPSPDSPATKYIMKIKSGEDLDSGGPKRRGVRALSQVGRVVVQEREKPQVCLHSLDGVRAVGKASGLRLHGATVKHVQRAKHGPTNAELEAVRAFIEDCVKTKGGCEACGASIDDIAAEERWRVHQVRIGMRARRVRRRHAHAACHH